MDLTGAGCYVLAAGWAQIKARMPNHTRAAQRGDDLGSRLIAAAMAADLARLAFLGPAATPPMNWEWR